MIDRQHRTGIATATATATYSHKSQTVISIDGHRHTVGKVVSTSPPVYNRTCEHHANLAAHCHRFLQQPRQPVATRLHVRGDELPVFVFAQHTVLVFVVCIASRESGNRRATQTLGARTLFPQLLQCLTVALNTFLDLCLLHVAELSRVAGQGFCPCLRFDKQPIKHQSHSLARSHARRRVPTSSITVMSRSWQTWIARRVSGKRQHSYHCCRTNLQTRSHAGKFGSEERVKRTPFRGWLVGRTACSSPATRPRRGRTFGSHGVGYVPLQSH